MNKETEKTIMDELFLSFDFLPIKGTPKDPTNEFGGFSKIFTLREFSRTIKIEEDILIDHLDELSKGGKFRVIDIKADADLVVDDLRIWLELGYGERAENVGCGIENYNLINDRVIPHRLYRDESIKPKERDKEEILNFKETALKRLDRGRAKIASRYPELSGSVEKQLRKEEREDEVELQNEIMKLIKSRKKK